MLPFPKLIEIILFISMCVYQLNFARGLFCINKDNITYSNFIWFTLIMGMISSGFPPLIRVHPWKGSASHHSMRTGLFVCSCGRFDIARR